MMYLVTITNNENGETSAFITHDKAEADKSVEDFNRRRPSGKAGLFSVQAPVEITEIEIH